MKTFFPSIILITFLTIPANLFSQRFEWVNFTPFVSGYPNAGSGGQALTVDNEGFVYTLATFSEPIKVGDDTIVPFFPGSTDIYLTKWSPDGSVLWARPFGGNWYDDGLDLAFDEVNNTIYASCHLQGTQTIMTDTSYTNTSDYQIIMFDTAGNCINNRFVAWSNIALAIQDEIIYFSDGWQVIRRTDPAGNTQFTLSPVVLSGYFFFTSVGITPQGELLAAGIFNGSFILGDDTVTAEAAPTGEGTFLMKANTSGQVIFAKYIGSLDLTYTVQIPLVADESGNIYLAERYSHDLVIGPDTLPFVSLTNSAFIARFDGEGNAIWGRHFFGAVNTQPYDILLHDGNLFCCGAYTGTMSYGDFTLPNGGLGFLTKMDTSGNYLYAKELGSYNGSSWAAAIGKGSNNNYFITGITYGGGANSVFGCYTQAYSNQYLTGFQDTVPIVPEVTIIQQNTQLVSSDNCNCSIQWYLNGTPIEGATGEVLEITENGDYYAIVQDDYNCSAQSNTINIPNAGNIELSSLSATITPNPFTSTLTIDLKDLPLNNSFSINIMNLSGQIVYNDKGENRKNLNNLTINLEALQNGVYILEIISDEERLVRKIVKI